MHLEELQTPCLILDRVALERNLETMRSIALRHGVKLRPHLKTAKSADIARMAVGGTAGGITVSTLAEAEYFADHGFADITLAAGITPQKLGRAAALLSRGVMLRVITDDEETAAAIARHPSPFRTLVEIDCGDHRGGISPNSDELLRIGRALGGKLDGVLTHAGHSYGCRDVECIKQVAEQERSAVVLAAKRLSGEGLTCETISVGSTPTMRHADNLDGVTEMRPGVYMFADLFQVEINSCEREDIAVTVLASVIGRRLDENRILVDAGALALSKDRSTQVTQHDAGYGVIWNLEGRPVYGNCVIDRVSQEHGNATSDVRLPFEELQVGTKVRIAMNHSCLTAAAYDRYYVVAGGQEVVETFDRVNGW
ncbi:MAG TPA: alanine racemase [Gemmatimonadaceae bacterium]|nr:alanine racemase [Gemmatimonadaceae bacterium]